MIFAAIMASCSVDEPDLVPDRQPDEKPQTYVPSSVPVLHIETEGNAPIVSKKEYIAGTYWLDPLGDDEIEALGSEENPLPLQIRGRGNSSWKSNKKPYKIKLAKKAAMVGMARSKHWALLSATEHTVAGLSLGKVAGMPWTPDFRPVEVFLNGDYVGLYFLTETIRIEKNRLNIYKQKDQETNPTLINGGWLVEVDNYRHECQFTIRENFQWNLTVRYHSPEDLSAMQREWLVNEFTAMNAAIYSTDKTSTTWEKYIDVESMARYFIIQEIMDNPDGFHGSFYLHKDYGGSSKWVAGPVWDLLCYDREKTDYTFRLTVHYRFIPHWIGEIIRYDSFRRAVRNIWNELYPDRLEELFPLIDQRMMILDDAWRNDNERWDRDPQQTPEVRAERIKAAIRRNIEWFNTHLP